MYEGASASAAAGPQLPLATEGARRRLPVDAVADRRAAASRPRLRIRSGGAVRRAPQSLRHTPGGAGQPETESGPARTV